MSYCEKTSGGFDREAAISATAVKHFNLSAAEAGRVADIVARSVRNYSITIDNAVNIVAPVAYRANLSIEETIAAIMYLDDRGINSKRGMKV